MGKEQEQAYLAPLARCCPCSSLKKNRNTGGWVLLETLAALTVLSVAIIAVNEALYESLVTRAQARDYTQARFFLDKLASELEMQPLFQDGMTQSGGFGEEHPRFSWSWSVSKADIPQPAIPQEVLLANGITELVLPVKALGKVSVTVRWTRAGHEFEETIETLIGPERILIKEEDEALEE